MPKSYDFTDSIIGHEVGGANSGVETNGKSKTIDTNVQNGITDSATLTDATASSAKDERGNWGSQLEFTLACVGYAVGLGNVWRFPHLVFRNGGGAFLVPYIIMVFLIGLPVFFAELFVGQYGGLGPIKSYQRLAPLFHGLGYCTLVVITFVTIYYMVIIAWILFYFFASFLPVLGWGSCDHDYNSNNCFSGLEDQACRQNNTGDGNDLLYWQRTCVTVSSICEPVNLLGYNAGNCLNTTTSELVPVRHLINRTLASEEYYYEYVLGLGDSSWENWGYPRWQLVLCLLLAWIIAFFCLIKGIKSAGKVIYFTALFPYVILTALLIRGATLEGAVDGIIFYIQPDWERLSSPAVWGDAASQIFYSFGLACGSLVSFASYNKFNNNCHTDTLVVSLTNVLTAIFAGFAIFAILGFMAFNMGVPVGEVVDSGPGLAFIAYPEAVLLMPLPQLWAVLFFFMMFILGMGSQFGGIEAICTAVIDHWPHLGKHHWRVTAGTCLFCFIAALPMVCNGGVYMFTLMDWHTASWAVLLLGMAEVVVISWVYGIHKTFDNLSEMGMKLHKIIRGYWWVVWMILSPIACLAVFIFIMTEITPTEFAGYLFPVWADVLGWLMGATTLAPFPIFLIYRVFVKGTRGVDLLKQSPKWGPQEGASQLTNEESPSAPSVDKINDIEELPSVPPSKDKFNGIDNVAFENN